jgi:hypothetical protein
MKGTVEEELTSRAAASLGGEIGGPVQGMFCLDPEGRVIGGQMHRYSGAGRSEHLEAALKEFAESRGPKEEARKPAVRRGCYAQTVPYRLGCPQGGAVLRVTNRFLDGGRPKKWSNNLGSQSDVEQYEGALGRDVLWIRRDEVEQLAAGRLPESLLKRLAIFHARNTTYGQYGSSWDMKDLKTLEVKLDAGRLSGTILLEHAKPPRTYRATVCGFVEGKGSTLRRFDAVLKGEWQELTDYEFKITNENRILGVGITLLRDGDPMRNITPGCLGGYSSLNVEDYLR